MPNSVENSHQISHYSVCLLGFSAAEKALVETYCRFAARRSIHWSVTADLGQATGVMVGAPTRQEFERYKAMFARDKKVAIVGSTAYETPWKLVPQPLSLVNALSIFDYFLHEPFNPPSQAQSPVSAAAPLTLPIQTLPSPVPAPRTVPTPARSDRVLLVDDSDVALKFMQSKMQQFGFASQLVHSGEEALAEISGQNFHFVFLDVNMAGMDGFQTCRAIKQNKARNGSVPVVILMTSRGGTIDKIRGTMAGCDAYLTKPLNENQLIAVLKKFRLFVAPMQSGK